MSKILLTGMILFVLLAVVYGCHDDKGITTDNDPFVTIYYGLDVTAEWDHYPALNESANVSITFKCKEWFQDSLLSLGIDSLESVQENNNTTGDAFFPQSGTLLWSESVSIYDTINWNFDLKPLREGRFSMTVGIRIIDDFGGLDELYLLAKRSFIWPYGFDYMCIDVEETQGYLCPEQPPTNGGSGDIIVDPVPDTAQ